LAAKGRGGWRERRSAGDGFEEVSEVAEDGEIAKDGVVTLGEVVDDDEEEGGGEGGEDVEEDVHGVEGFYLNRRPQRSRRKMSMSGGWAKKVRTLNLGGIGYQYE
jgi:hypothetical protein